MLHNISVVCPTISTYVSNYYQSAPRLFVIGGKEILCTEGTIHSDPTSMGTYALEGGDSFTSFSTWIHINNWKQKLRSGFCRWSNISREYKRNKAILGTITPNGSNIRPKFIFKGNEVNITKSGQRHLAAAIGSKKFNGEYMESVVNNWNYQLSLSKIAEMEPKAAYAAFIGGSKSKFKYFLQTIPDIHEYFNL